MNWEDETNLQSAKQMHIFNLEMDLGLILPFLFSVKCYLKILLLIVRVMIIILIIFTTIFATEWSNNSMLPVFNVIQCNAANLG